MKKESSDIVFDKFLVQEYFKLGSINKVFKKHRYSLPISFAGYDRLLNKYNVVKSAGPNSQFSESLYILSLLASYKIPLERIYHRLAPRSVQVSTNTLHRILHYTRLGLTRRQGAVLIISPEDEPKKVLMGNDISLSKKSLLGKKGDITLPMGYTKVGETPQVSITRILQNEVFTNLVISQNFPWKMIPKHIKPLMSINIADIKVSVYKILLPSNHPRFSSYKLQNLGLKEIEKIDFEEARPGVREILNVYTNPDILDSSSKTVCIDSELNLKLFALAEETVE